jgi:hypothetical protein
MAALRRIRSLSAVGEGAQGFEMHHLPIYLSEGQVTSCTCLDSDDHGRSQSHPNRTTTGEANRIHCGASHCFVNPRIIEALRVPVDGSRGPGSLKVADDRAIVCQGEKAQGGFGPAGF